MLTRNLILAAVVDDAVHTGITDELERPMITELIEKIRSCGVSFKVYPRNGEYEFTSLVGNDKKKLLQKLPDKIPECQPKEYANSVKALWEVIVALAAFTHYYALHDRTLQICMRPLKDAPKKCILGKATNTIQHQICSNYNTRQTN